MALHRDIYWVGRQWAVTGFGIQAVDQRLRGVLDVEAARLWDDELIASRRAKPGLNVEDFDKALSAARVRWPQAPDPPAAKPTPMPPVRRAEAPRIPAEAEVDSLIARLSQLERPEIDDPPAAPPAVSAAPVAIRSSLALRAEGRLARFLPQWRVRR
jgi:hypothetical protein